MVELSPTANHFAETLKLLRNNDSKNDTEDTQEFQKRVKTFILGQKWVGKPFALSPPACARFGWKCCGPNKLQCVSCSATLCTSLPEMEKCTSYDKCVLEVGNSLKSAHRKHCPWPLAPCPENFFRMVHVQKEAAYESFISRLESLLPIQNFLPDVKDTVVETLALSDDHFKALCELSHISQSPFTKSAILLATTGWRRMPDAGKKKYITCVHCLRTVGVWFYSSVQSRLKECTPKVEEAGEVLPTVHDSPQLTENMLAIANSSLDGTCTGKDIIVAASAPSNYKEVVAASQNCEEGISAPENCEEAASTSQNHVEIAGDPQNGKEVICKQENADNFDSPDLLNGKRLSSGNDSCISENQSPRKKRKLCLETDKPFNPLYEHRPWCMWISRTGIADSHQSSKDNSIQSPKRNDFVPGYKVYIECLLKNVGNSDSSPCSASSPTREELYEARELLITWSSPV